MQIALLADIHGNLPALQAVLADMAEQGIQKLAVAGDLIGGPRPNETLALLRERRAHLILGNGDRYLLRYSRGEAPLYWYTQAAFAAIRWQFRQCSRETLEYLAALPEQLVIRDGLAPQIRLVHGSHRDMEEGLFPMEKPERLTAALASTSEPVLACGHTHQAWWLRRGERLAVNPGAVGCPLDGQIGAQYAILSWADGLWEVEQRLVAYDLNHARAAFRDSGFLEAGGGFARACLNSIESGRDVTRAFLDHARHVADEAGFIGSEYVPDVPWRQAEATFNWPDRPAVYAKQMEPQQISP